ncbi:hypothetical protein T484DRAFT_1933150 [Baffinella frigidus]|nr:hypothetical protein T484DRAFT_1933150 [Cryptophyta sp. CCMP2293]
MGPAVLVGASSSSSSIMVGASSSSDGVRGPPPPPQLEAALGWRVSALTPTIGRLSNAGLQLSSQGAVASSVPDAERPGPQRRRSTLAEDFEEMPTTPARGGDEGSFKGGRAHRMQVANQGAGGKKGERKTSASSSGHLSINTSMHPEGGDIHLGPLGGKSWAAGVVFQEQSPARALNFPPGLEHHHHPAHREASTEDSREIVDSGDSHVRVGHTHHREKLQSGGNVGSPLREIQLGLPSPRRHFEVQHEAFHRDKVEYGGNVGSPMREIQLGLPSPPRMYYEVRCQTLPDASRCAIEACSCRWVTFSTLNPEPHPLHQPKTLWFMNPNP